MPFRRRACKTLYSTNRRVVLLSELHRCDEMEKVQDAQRAPVCAFLYAKAADVGFNSHENMSWPRDVR